MANSRFPASQSLDGADVLDMVARLKQAAERATAAPKPTAMAEASNGEWDFPAEFYQYFHIEQAA